MPDSPFLCTPASLFRLIFLLFLALLVDVFSVIGYILRQHQPGNMEEANALKFDVEVWAGFDLF
jgi:cytochrome c biogenesis protein ResB